MAAIVRRAVSGSAGWRTASAAAAERQASHEAKEFTRGP